MQKCSWVHLSCLVLIIHFSPPPFTACSEYYCLVYWHWWKWLNLFNPSTPVLPITTCEEPCPLFQFWHHLWPNLASSILNFWRRERSFQWYPDLSDQLNGAWIMQDLNENSEQISCHYIWLLHGKNGPSLWCFLWYFWTGSKLSRISITAPKNKKRIKRKGKKIKTNGKPKDICACQSLNVVKRDASGKKAMLSCCRCLLSRFRLIWPISS